MLEEKNTHVVDMYEIICKTNFNIGMLGPFNRTDLVPVLPVKNSPGGILLKVIVCVIQCQKKLLPSYFVEQAYTSHNPRKTLC